MKGKDFTPSPGVQALSSLLEYATKRAMAVRAKDTERRYGISNGKMTAVGAARILRELLPKTDLTDGMFVSERAMNVIANDLLRTHAPEYRIPKAMVAAALRDMATLPDGLAGTGFSASPHSRGFIYTKPEPLEETK